VPSRIIVECQGLIHHKGKTGGCGRIYTPRREAWKRRLNTCPECGSSKAKQAGSCRGVDNTDE